MPEPTPPPVPCGTFTHDPDAHPADILQNVAFVARFLAEVSLHFHSDRDPGLSEDAAQGLYHILCGVENTINDAMARL